MTQATKIYSSLRQVPGMIEDLMSIESIDEVAEKVETFAASQGETLTRADFHEALADLPALIVKVGGDELTDAELELVSGGVATSGDGDLKGV